MSVRTKIPEKIMLLVYNNKTNYEYNNFINFLLPMDKITCPKSLKVHIKQNKSQ